ncbi:MSHA biogenesis protein MshK [Vibrio galatheae]|uniref:MSHA biogenesis protein MshK n=1 Tax=Vibrio galatheae TaxID=579748 RepID=A0A0F4NG12_9VIBR|nr:hypothetical protein [Vibrio galatheae]KJY82040.1 MSHA biogenesis protein MshK [Vibrio galatheae]
MVRIWLFLLIFSTSAVASQDPTAPLGWQQPLQNEAAKVKRKPLPALQSIVCIENNQNECHAVLDGQVVLVGEQIGGYKISHIKPDTVTLVKGGKSWNLNLFSLEVKQ